MKKILIATLLLSSFCANAQAGSSGIESAEPIDSTGFGKPDGKLARKEIGAAGGTIISEDGRVELIFPAGAVTTNTIISIQPTTNLAPNGVGKSYWFEPSGTQFKKSVQIIFHYTDKESERGSPELMALGMQDHKGRWTLIDYDDWDSTAKVLKGFIHHFTGLSNLYWVSVKANDDVLLVGDTTVLELIDLNRPRDTPYTRFEMAELRENAPNIWYANGVVNGNPGTGKIEKVEFNGYRTYPGYTTKGIQARYVAPKYLPKKNPVEISVEIYRKTKKGKILKRKAVCYIQVFDAYRVSVISEFLTRAGMDGKLIDSANFTLYIWQSSLEVTDIKNYNPTVIKEGKQGPFREKLFTKAAQGSIHLTPEIKVDSVRNKYPKVCFEFQPVDEIVWYLFQTRARGIGGPVEPLVSPSIRVEINFLPNGEEQSYTTSLGKSKESYKVIIKPLRNIHFQ